MLANIWDRNYQALAAEEDGVVVGEQEPHNHDQPQPRRRTSHRIPSDEEQDLYDSLQSQTFLMKNSCQELECQHVNCSGNHRRNSIMSERELSSSSPMVPRDPDERDVGPDFAEAEGAQQPPPQPQDQQQLNESDDNTMDHQSSSSISRRSSSESKGHNSDPLSHSGIGDLPDFRSYAGDRRTSEGTLQTFSMGTSMNSIRSSLTSHYTQESSNSSLLAAWGTGNFMDEDEQGGSSNDQQQPPSEGVSSSEAASAPSSSSTSRPQHLPLGLSSFASGGGLLRSTCLSSRPSSCPSSTSRSSSASEGSSRLSGSVTGLGLSASGRPRPSALPVGSSFSSRRASTGNTTTAATTTTTTPASTGSSRAQSQGSAYLGGILRSRKRSSPVPSGSTSANRNVFPSGPLFGTGDGNSLASSSSKNSFAQGQGSNGSCSSSSGAAAAAAAAPLGLRIDPVPSASELIGRMSASETNRSADTAPLRGNADYGSSATSNVLSLGGRRRYTESNVPTTSAPGIDRPGSRRPKKPTSAYSYFFRDQCQKLVRDGHYTGDGFDSDVTTSPGGSTKRRKSDSGEAVDVPPLEDMGRIVAERWRAASSFERARYQAMEERDAERYRDEIQDYYRNNGDAVQCLVGTQNRLGGASAPLSIQAEGGEGAAASGAAGSFSPRTITPFATDNDFSTPASPQSNTGSNATMALARPTPSTSGRKSFLQAQLSQKRTELLNDISSLNDIAASRIAVGKPAFRQDAAVMQRLYNLGVGPLGSAAAGGSSRFARLGNGPIGGSAGRSSSLPGPLGLGGLGTGASMGGCVLGGNSSLAGVISSSNSIANGSSISNAGAFGSSVPSSTFRRSSASSLGLGRQNSFASASGVTIELLDEPATKPSAPS